MDLYRLNFLILFILIVIGVNASEKAEPSANALKTGTDVIPSHETSSSKITNKSAISANDVSLISEGQYSVPQKAASSKETKEKNSTTLPIKTHIDTLLDGTTKIKNKSVVGRKGVNFNLLDDTADTHKPENTAKVNSGPAEIPSTKTNNTKVIMKKLTDSTVNLKPVNPEPVPVVHKKPVVLAYGALQSIVADKTSLSGTESGVPLKQPINPSSRPGMVMPIVITILVVPMFAVLGYMALRRGQEAWKNRHYKRMDFLLDGMYNE